MCVSRTTNQPSLWRLTPGTARLIPAGTLGTNAAFCTPSPSPPHISGWEGGMRRRSRLLGRIFLDLAIVERLQWSRIRRVNRLDDGNLLGSDFDRLRKEQPVHALRTGSLDARHRLYGAWSRPSHTCFHCMASPAVSCEAGSLPPGACLLNHPRLLTAIPRVPASPLGASSSSFVTMSGSTISCPESR
jgi:hypothetical protein